MLAASSVDPARSAKSTVASLRSAVSPPPSGRPQLGQKRAPSGGQAPQLGQRVDGIGVTGRMPEAAATGPPVGCASPPPQRRPFAPAPTSWSCRSRKPPLLEGAAAEVDKAMGGALKRLIDAGEIRGARGQVTVVHADGGVRARRVAVAGLGDSPAADDVRHAAALGARAAAAARATSIAFVVDAVPLERELATRCLVEGDAARRLPVRPLPDRTRGRAARQARVARPDRRRPPPGPARRRRRDGRQPRPRPAEHALQPPRPAAARRAGAGDRGRARARSPPPSTTAASSSAGGWARSWRSPPPAARSPR